MRSSAQCRSCATIVAVALCFSRPAGAHALDLVRNGRPVATIVIPDTPCPIALDAAQCLNKYVQAISGTRLEMLPEAKIGERSTNLVVLGDTRMTRQAGIDASEIPYDGYVHRVVGNRFFIAGPDEALSAKVKDSENPVLHFLYDQASAGMPWKGVLDRRGTLNGVIRFLQDHCGVRWFIPTPNGELVPRSDRISVPDGLDNREVPAFVCAFARNCSGREPTIPIWVYTPGRYWAAANSFRMPISFLFIGGHSWNAQVRVFADSPEALFELHPEYFSRRQAGRALARRSHSSVLCTSNPEVISLLTVTMRQFFEQGWDMMQYNQSDGYHRCTCPRCEALDGYRGYEGGYFTEPCERLFVALEQMARRCKASHPAKKIMAMSYGPTKLPSRVIEKFPDNVLFQAAHTEAEDFERWRGKAQLFGVWLYWLGPLQAPGVSVRCTPRAAAERLRRYHANGVKLLYWGMGSSGENWGNEGPVYYTIGQLMRDPTADYQPFLDEYYAGVYGKAAPIMKQYFERLYERLDEHFIPKCWDMRAEVFFATVYPPEFLEAQEELLESAQAKAREERSKQWLALTTDQFLHIKTTAMVFHRYHDFQAARDMHSLRRLKATIGERNAYLDRLRAYGKDPQYVKDWYPGYSGFLRYAPLGRKNRPKLADPFTWDFTDLDGLLRKRSGTAERP